MTLDDETAERIANEAWAKRGKRHTVSGEEYVRAGWDARDAEVEELRAMLAKAGEKFENLSGRVDVASARIAAQRDAALATLAKVREWAERCFRSPRDGVDGRTDWEYLLSAILDESPTDMATALAGAGDVERIGPDFAPSPIERETPADEWEYGRAGRFVNDGTDARDDWWYGPRTAADANISLLNEQEVLALIESLANDPSLRLSGHSGISIRGLREKARERREGVS